MDVNTEIESFSENSIYEGIFNIFELELEEISHFVAFTNSNMNVYSNKIHELHLRVCSEIENILKIVIHKHFVSEEEVKALWDAKKSAFLDKKSLTSKYEELKNELNSSNKREVDRLLFGFPDFAFYLNLACNKFNLHQKVIKFLGMVSHIIDWEVIQPFEMERGQNVPIWWTNYNKLKHDKINNFHLCKLGDLIYSLSGLFILMNYLLKYRDDNTPIENRNYRIEKMTKSVAALDCNFCSFKSNFFQATNAYQHPVYSFIFPELLTEDDYQNVRLIHLEKRAGQKFRNIAKYENNKLADMDLKSFEYRMENKLNNKNDKLRSIKHSLFYTYLDYVRTINFRHEHFRELRLFGKLIN